MNTLRNHFIKASLASPIPSPEGYIQYTSNSGYISPYNTAAFNSNIIDNYYDSDYACYFIKFDSPVTSIGESAFYKCSGLTAITIPNSVTSIGARTFYWCEGLTSITIPESVTSIGILAFDRCGKLTSVIIPKSVTNIGSYAFQNCISLKSITFQGTIAQWQEISLGDGWKSNAPSITVVHCTDGDAKV